nr:MAG TPA: hypothetical protein [Caudoviricetes sp.]
MHNKNLLCFKHRRFLVFKTVQFIISKCNIIL